MRNLHSYLTFGISSFLLAIIDLVFFILISIPYSLPLSFTVVNRFCNFCSSRTSNDVSSAYLKLLILCPPTSLPYTFFIWNSSVMPCSVYSQYILVIICRSLSSISISDRHSLIVECFTISKALV